MTRISVMQKLEKLILDPQKIHKQLVKEINRIYKDDKFSVKQKVVSLYDTQTTLNSLMKLDMVSLFLLVLLIILVVLSVM